MRKSTRLPGPALGWPRTGTFRLADMVGIDILAHVAANFPQGVTPGGFSEILQEIVKRGWLGDKSGQGFYKKRRGADGKDQRLVLDLATFEYRPSVKPALPSLDMAKNAATVQERAAAAAGQRSSEGQGRKVSVAVSVFAVELCRGPHRRSRRRRAVDRSAPCARDSTGNWGRLRCGMRRACASPSTRMKALNIPVSAAVRGLLDSAPESTPVSWYSPDGPQCYNPVSGAWEPIPQQPGPCPRGRFPPGAWSGAKQSRRIAGRSGRRYRLHRAALAEERHRRRRGGDDHVGSSNPDLRRGARFLPAL